MIDIEKMKALAAFADRLRVEDTLCKFRCFTEEADLIYALLSELEAREADRRELLSLLPRPYYMDPPDGGDVSMIEQLRRMAKDAERYRKWVSYSGFTKEHADSTLDAIPINEYAALAQRQEGEDDERA